MVRALGVTSFLLLLSEAVHCIASRRVAPSSDAPGETMAVIALGYGVPRSPFRQGIHRWRVEIATVQRWRVDIAVRSLAAGGSGCVIFSGSGASEGDGLSEADAMVAYATSELGLDPGCIRVERNAKHTWQNVEYALRLAEGYDRIAIASDPLHAARATRYAARQRPDLIGRLCAADTYRVFERWWLKAPIALYEGWRWIRDRSFERQEQRSK